MATRPHFTDGIHGLAVFIRFNPKRHFVQGTQLIRIHDKFLKGGHQAALKPTAGMQHEIHTSQQSRVKCIGSFIGRLRVWQFRATEATTGAEGQIHPTRQLSGSIENLAGFRRAKGRSARIHIDRGHKCTKNHRSARLQNLAIGNARQDLSQNLRQGTHNRHRSHSATHDKG